MISRKNVKSLPKPKAATKPAMKSMGTGKAPKMPKMGGKMGKGC